MNKRTVYRLLEDKMLGYRDYADMPVRPKPEKLLAIKANPHLKARQADAAMMPYTGDMVLVRQGLLDRLQTAGKLLAAYDDGLQLEVIYGYRAPEIQSQLFEKYRASLAGKYGGSELVEAAHRLVAVPDAAGHPAGAAVDLQIVRSGKALDFGTKIWEFVPDSFAYSPFVSKIAWENRQLLRRIMLAVGFAPFDGEWWHFSYGDKEWAKYYGRPFAIYEQVKDPARSAARGAA